MGTVEHELMRGGPRGTGTTRPRPFVVLLLELSKARLSLLVLLTTAVGYLLAGAEAGWLRFAGVLFGTGLAAFGANALNQCIEADRDARMERTRGRPLPAGELSLRSAWSFAMGMAAAGPIVLWLLVNTLTAILGTICVLLYVLVYTPLKARSPQNTLVGAVIGGIPPLMGWAAAANTLDAGAWVLGLILFFWQLPHFFALAWMCRDDYRRAGFRMLSVVDDASGRRTCNAIVVYCVALVHVSLLLTLVGVTGSIFAVGAGVLGSLFLLLGVQFYNERTQRNARRVFLASIAYLSLLMCLMLVDRGPLARVPPETLPEATVLVAAFDAHNLPAERPQ